MPACEAVNTHRFFGSEACGAEATKKIKIPWDYQVEVYICDTHYAEYFGAFLEREYAYYQILKEKGLETDD